MKDQLSFFINYDPCWCQKSEEYKKHLFSITLSVPFKDGLVFQEKCFTLVKGDKIKLWNESVKGVNSLLGYLPQNKVIVKDGDKNGEILFYPHVDSHVGLIVAERGFILQRNYLLCCLSSLRFARLFFHPLKCIRNLFVAVKGEGQFLANTMGEIYEIEIDEAIAIDNIHLPLSGVIGFSKGVKCEVHSINSIKSYGMFTGSGKIYYCNTDKSGKTLDDSWKSCINANFKLISVSKEDFKRTTFLKVEKLNQSSEPKVGIDLLGCHL